MEEKDIEILIKARKDQARLALISTLAMTALLAIMVLEGFQITDRYTTTLAALALALMAVSKGASRWVAVTREQLIDVLERAVARDPEALALLGQKRKADPSRRA